MKEDTTSASVLSGLWQSSIDGQLANVSLGAEQAVPLQRGLGKGV